MLSEGIIYIVNCDEIDVPLGTLVEFLGGPDDSTFSDGQHFYDLDETEVLRSSSQDPLEYTLEASKGKSRALAGFPITGEFNDPI